MKRIILVCLLLLSFSSNTFGQKRYKKGVHIKNDYVVIKENKVSSITFSKYFYEDAKRKRLRAVGKKLWTEIFDSLGRKEQVLSYNDSNGSFRRTKYFYVDTVGEAFYRKEIYNEQDSLIKVDLAEMKGEEYIYMREGGGVSCFGYYEFHYDKKRLIKEAVWLCPKEDIWANDKMSPCYVIKLVYTFRK